jgi:hypothetical protein
MHEMHATQLVDSSSRAPYLPDAAGMLLCLGRMIFRLKENQSGRVFNFAAILEPDTHFDLKVL